MKHKYDTSKLLQNFVTLIETQFHKCIKATHSDNGLEFSMKSLFSTMRIRHETSCVYTLQQNGFVERKRQHVLSMVRALVFQSNIHKFFWNYAVGHAVHLINRLPSKFLKYNSPYQVLHNSILDISHLRVFGCLAFASTNSPSHGKLDVWSCKCLFLGYVSSTKG